MTTVTDVERKLGQHVKWLAVSVGVIVWVLAVFVPYYVVHKPIALPLHVIWEINRQLLASGWSPRGLGETASNLGAGILIVGLCVGLGWRLLQLWPDRVAGRARGPKYSPLLTRFCFSAGLGLGVLGLVVFVLSASGQLYGRSIVLLLALIAILCLSGLRHGLPAMPSVEELLGSERLTRFEWALLLSITVAVALALVSALGPPTAWDSLVYHLTAPKLSLLVHGFPAGVDVAHFYFPELIEMLFVVALAIKGPIAAQVVQVAFLVLSLVALYAFSQQHFNRRVGLLACAIFSSAQSILILGSQAYVDVALVFFLFLAFWALYDSVGGASETGGRGRPSSSSMLVLSAVFAGFGMSVKYTSAPFVVALVVLAAWVALRSEGGARGAHVWRRLVPVGTWCGFAIMAACPWYVKNVGLTGNPVYPFVFGGWAWDEWRSEWYLRAGTGLLNEPLRLLLAPVEMTILGIEGAKGYQATIGPLFLLTLPLVLLVPRGRAVRWALVVCGLVYVVWLAGVAESRLLQQTRLLLPIFSLLALIGALAVDRLRSWDRPWFRLQTVVAAALILALGTNLISQATTVAVSAPWAYAVGADDRESYLARHLGEYYRAMGFLDHELPEEARVWFLWEPRSFYTDRQVQPDALLDNWAHTLYLRGDPKAVRDDLVARGFCHVLVYRAGLVFFLTPPNREVADEELDALRRFERSYLKLVWGDPLDELGPGMDMADIGSRYAIYQLR